MIRKAVLQQPEAFVAVTVRLWERLASELISIIGENGFQSLFLRSVHITRNSYPWIVARHPFPKFEPRFDGLQISLEGREIEEASEASILLLITLVDIMTLLIGELLMNRILRSAWGHEMLDAAGKEHRQ